MKMSAATTADSGGFEMTTRVLLHELEHVIQYRDQGYNIPLFGLKYLFGWCKAGMSYSNIPQEVQARQWEVCHCSDFTRPRR
jgi:hypothetical protein